MAASVQPQAQQATTATLSPSPRHRRTRTEDAAAVGFPDDAIPRPAVAADSQGKSNRELPCGACNYKDIGITPKPPTCGCRRFWEEEQGFRRMWCVCGHHACYHDRVERATGADSSMAPPVAPSSSRFRQPPWQAPGPATMSQSAGPKVWKTPSPGNIRGGAYELPHSDARVGPGRRHGNDSPQSANITPSDISSSGLPRLPSCLLLDTRPETPPPMEVKGKKPVAGEFPAGLGLFLGEASRQRAPSLCSTVFDPITMPDLPPLGSQVPSTRQASTDDGRNLSPDPAFMQRLMKQRLGPPLDVSRVQPPAIVFEDLVQSATEIATPSIAATPDLTALDNLVQETKDLAETLAVVEPTSRADRAAGKLRTALDRSPTPDQQSNSSKVIPSSASQAPPVNQALSLLPSTLGRIVANLNCIQTQLSSFPMSIVRLSERLDALENASFSHVPPEEFHDRFEMVDTRLVDAEQRLDEQSRRLATVEVTHTETHYRHESHTGSIAPPEGSFISHHSAACSATSSALIAAAIERTQTEAKLNDIEERLCDLETFALPSVARPWEMEVVFLPWGRDLRGVWFTPGDSSRTGPRKPTHEDEEEDWTHARALRSQSKTSTSFHSSGQPGWSSEAIQDWANDADEWLWPKACGTNGVVYHRLRSRGLVRKVILRGPGAKDTQTAIRSAFGELMTIISGNLKEDEDSQLFEDDAHNRTYFGLNAPFVPLRKLHKSSKLRFLTPSEMVTPAIWNAEFLASGLLMRAAGGQKRLFITNREAYLQRSGDTYPAWTWQKLRELPRVLFDNDSVANSDGGPQDAQVSEGDAKEACWFHYAALDDPPQSVQSSFVSLHSRCSIRTQPAIAAYHGGSPTEVRASIDAPSEPESRPVQPITPISEYPTQGTLTRGRHRRQRTVSVPLTDASSSAIAAIVDKDRISKRRVRSFEVPTNPLIDKLPSFISPISRSNTRRGKRRRINRSTERSASGSGDLPRQQQSVDFGQPQQSEELSADMVRGHPSWTMFTPRSRPRSESKESEHTSHFFEQMYKSCGAHAAGGCDNGRQHKRRSSADFYAELNARIVEDMRRDNNVAVVEDTMYGGSASAGSRKRGTTPFAYATPYSGPPLMKPEPGHDTGMDEDEIWEGVREESDDGVDEEEASGSDDNDDMQLDPGPEGTVKQPRHITEQLGSQTNTGVSGATTNVSSP